MNEIKVVQKIYDLMPISNVIYENTDYNFEQE